MHICIITPRFHPVIGGNENYLKNIVIYLSNYFKISVITSDLKSTLGLFEKERYIKQKSEKFSKNVRIFRIKTNRSILLKYLFYLNEFINNRLEKYFRKFFYKNLENKINLIISKKVSNFIIKYIFIPQQLFKNPNLIKIYFMLVKINNNEKIDLVHSSPVYLTPNICAFLFSKIHGIPYICTPLYHIKPFKDSIFYPSFQYILENSEEVIALTYLEKEFYLKFGIKKKKIAVIPPGININKYKISNINQFKNKFFIKDNDIILFFLGRRTFEKGFIQTILAQKYLLKKFKNIKLMIGGPMKRDYRIFLKNFSIQNDSNIIDLGYVDEKTKAIAYSICDIFVLPSIEDSFGIVYLEAWLYKKPVIGASGGNVEGLIDNNINGILVPFNNIKILSEKLEYLIRNKEKRIELGFNGYKKLIQDFNIDVINNDILALYRKYKN